jgi:hypothetical protein
VINEYIWNLQPEEQVLLWIGGAIAYTICGGFTWALTPESWDSPSSPDWNDMPIRHLAAVGWPIALVIYIVYSAAMIGPRTVAYWRQRNRLPRADARNRTKP